MINDSMKECRYCSVPVDPGIAQLIAGKQAQANQACSDASYLRTTSIAMYVSMVLSLIPYIPLVSPAFVIIFVVAVVLLIRWQVKFGSLIISDQDYQAARRSWKISLVMVIAAVPLGFIVRPIVQAVLFYRLTGD
jgi:hypothetical protein